MKLRTKAVLFTALLYIPLCLIFYSGLRILQMRNYSRLEQDAVRENMDRVVNALRNDMAQMDSILHDWASWDDLYGYVGDTNEAFARGNLLPEALNGIHINLMLILQPADQLFYSSAYDLEAEEAVPLSSQLLPYIQAHYGQMTPVSPPTSVQTIITLPGEPPLLYASRHILNSRNEGPSRGYLVMGRYMTDEYMKNLCTITANRINLLRLSDDLTGNDRKACETLLAYSKTNALAKNERVIIPQDERMIEGYTLLFDALGEPAFMLRIENPRHIYQNGLLSLRYMLLYILAVSILSGIILMILLERLLVARMIALSSQLTAIADEPDQRSLPEPRGSDELASVVRHINALLETLSARRLALQESEEKYRSFAEHFQGIAFRCNLHFKPIFFHGAVENITGYSESELLNEKPAWLDIVLPEDVPLVRQSIEECSQEKHFSCERQYRILHRDGSIRWVHEFLQNVSAPGESEPCHIQGSMYDITATKKAEAELKLAKQQMDHLARHLQDVREIEKSRLARQLHDELGQLLMALKIDMKWLAKKVDPAYVPSNHISSMLNMLADVEACVKHIATELKPGVLEKLDLQDAIEWLIHSFSKEHTIPCDFTIDMGNTQPDKRTSTIIFRILQEGLINIFRHSQATQVHLSVSVKEGVLQATLSDNGVGVPPDILNSFTSFGLIQMRERVDSLGGRIVFTSPPDGGFIISMDVPITAKSVRWPEYEAQGEEYL